MEIVQERWTEHLESFSLHYEWDDDPGAGFGFECDSQGHVDIENLNPAARENYESCLRGVVRGEKVHFVKIFHDQWTYNHPRVIRCTCGEEVVLYNHFTNTCDKCDRDFDGYGHGLAPRPQWGEETGEHYTDIVNMRGPWDDNY